MRPSPYALRVRAPAATVTDAAVTLDPNAPEIPNVPDVDADHVEK
jgi:hypothetical protein